MIISITVKACKAVKCPMSSVKEKLFFLLFPSTLTFSYTFSLSSYSQSLLKAFLLSLLLLIFSVWIIMNRYRNRTRNILSLVILLLARFFDHILSFYKKEQHGTQIRFFFFLVYKSNINKGTFHIYLTTSL